MSKKTESNENNLINPFLPSGVKDILPAEAKELKYIKRKLAKSYELWGYDEVYTPVFEYLDVSGLQTGERIKKEMFKFLDDNGDLLALRPDMTTSIARLVSQKLTEKPKPLRLYYQANVFRQQKPLQGQPREFWQSGIELIGGDTIASDGEIIMLLVDTLKSFNLKNFKIGLSNISFIKALLDDLGERGQRLKKYLAKGDFVAVDEILGRTKGKNAKNLKQLLSLRGPKALSAAKKMSFSKKAKNALDQLSKLAALLSKLGYDENVTYDFSLIPDFDYYTGVVFEAYAEGVGAPLASGGRYDNLLSKLGKPFKAAGFAIGLERLHLAMVNQGQSKIDRAPKVILQGRATKESFEMAATLRDNNIAVSMITDKPKDTLGFLKGTGAKWLVMVQGEIVKIVTTKEEKVVKLKDFKKRGLDA
ncbi:hypothetical protein LCGC14_1697730 [marine sediment metagenome]|uniref:Aminoacyl-transfer RNA synthetases class-II family profile domain-containing protein n=1 Tax=marine sediment metagenome TaxID=412755 RepID=A0A0F9JZF0_9ZZZZ